MRAKNYLPKLKATKYTYFNLDQKAVSDFKKLYNFIKRHGDKNVPKMYHNKIKFILDDTKEIEYLKKYKAMHLISTSI